MTVVRTKGLFIALFFFHGNKLVSNNPLLVFAATGFSRSSYNYNTVPQLEPSGLCSRRQKEGGVQGQRVCLQAEWASIFKICLF